MSRARRLAPTGTRTTRSARTWACSTGVLGWVEVVVAAVRRVRRRLAAARRVLVLLRVALLLRAPVVLLLVVAMLFLRFAPGRTKDISFNHVGGDRPRASLLPALPRDSRFRTCVCKPQARGGYTALFSPVRSSQAEGSSSSASVGRASGAENTCLSASGPRSRTISSQKYLPFSYWRSLRSR